MKLVIATNNAHKLAEIRSILQRRFEQIYSLADMGINVEIEETGNTLQENSAIKARYIRQFTDFAVLADDTGLCVDVLDGKPGVYSARYSGENACERSNRAKLLNELKGKSNRKAYFATCITLIMPNGSELSVIGKHEGEITDAETGENGFGYDSIFYSFQLKKTFAQATESEKNSVSHRATALNNLLKELEK